MPNSALKDNLYHTGDGNKEKFTSLAMQESRLKKAKEIGVSTGNWEEFKRLGGEAELMKISNMLKLSKTANKGLKKTNMDAGRENQFIDTHEKDRDNANPTGVGGVPIIHKGSMKDKIMTGKERYNEDLKKEISDIRYLIEYMNNNKKKI